MTILYFYTQHNQIPTPSVYKLQNEAKDIIQ